MAFGNGTPQYPKRLDGVGDYSARPQLRQPAPNPGAIQPHGPANFPVTTPGNETTQELLRQIRDELRGQNIATKAVIRSAAVDDVGVTLDYSQVGLMGRIQFRNKGPDSVWIAADTEGEAIEAFTGDQSIEVQANESWCTPNELFSKIGCKCAAGETATVHSKAFVATAGNLGLAIA